MIDLAPYFFIYGGMTQEKKILFDIYALNCENYTWKRFFSLEGPIARLNSAFANMGLKKYFIGGASHPENLVLNDVWSLSFGKIIIYLLVIYFKYRKCCMGFK